jgi:hypothetical protein
MRLDAARREVREAVNHPSHYGGDTPFEHVKVAGEMGWVANAFIYNATKYLWRLGKKGKRLEDLRKAIWYLQREEQRLAFIEALEKSPLLNSNVISNDDAAFLARRDRREATCLELGCDTISTPATHSVYCRFYAP